MPELNATSPRIVVLSTETLFAAGIVAHLRQSLAPQSLQTVDARQPEMLGRLAALQPSLVLLDASDASLGDGGLLDGLLRALPTLTVIRLDPQQGQMQLVTSRQVSLTQISDLVAVIGALTSPTAARPPAPDGNLEPKEEAV